MLQRANQSEAQTNARMRLGATATSLFKSPSSSDYQSADAIGHFYGVDLLRALAAVVILVWHYQIFYITGPAAEVSQRLLTDKGIQPFYKLLMPAYEHGFWAVHLFWAISGFVFCHVYAGRNTKASDFTGSRFARLYPLHFVTLVIITALQELSYSLVGRYQVSGSNDQIGFALNLLFVSGWGFQSGENFNAPIWSVSVEIAIYALFFLLARRVYYFGIAVPAAIVFICLLFISNQSPVNNFHLCGFFFFLGCASYFWVLKFKDRPAFILAPCVVSLAIFGHYIWSGALSHMRFYHVSVFLIAPIVMLVGWSDFSARIRAKLKPLKWFGDTTYSTYLWHFPIQIAVLLAFAYFGLDHMVFNNKIVLVAWIVGVVVLGHFSFRYIERPFQKFFLRQFKTLEKQTDRP